MANQRLQTADMIHGPLLKNIWIFAVPLMLTNFLQMLFNAADTVIVGRFAGQQALAAVGATSSLCFMLISLFNGLSMGSNVIIARFLGAGDTERVERAVHTAIGTSVIGGLFLMVVGNIICRPMLQLMSTPADIIDLSVLYMRIYFVGAFFSIIYNFGSSILRAKGDTKKPLRFLFISGLANVLLNLLFVVVFHMSVAGVAIATAISHAISASLVIIELRKQTDATRLDFKKLRIDASMAWNIIRIGIPAGIQGMVFSLSNVVVQSSLNSFGSSAIVAGNSAAANVESFVYIGTMAFTQSCMTFTSQNIGARNYPRVKEVMKLTMLLTIISAFTISFCMWIFGDFFLGLYTTEAAVIDVGKIRLTYVVLPLVLNGILVVFVFSMRGMGYSLLPTITMVLGICGIRLTWLWTVFPIHHTLPVIYLCFPISWFVTGLVQSVNKKKCHKRLLTDANHLT